MPATLTREGGCHPNLHETYEPDGSSSLRQEGETAVAGTALNRAHPRCNGALAAAMPPSTPFPLRSKNGRHGHGRGEEIPRCPGDGSAGSQSCPGGAGDGTTCDEL